MKVAKAWIDPARALCVNPESGAPQVGSYSGDFIQSVEN